MKSRLCLLAALGLASLQLSACATVTRGTKDSFVVQTTPPGAQVSMSNGYACPSTPCAVKMPRRSEFVATVSKPGYQPVQANITNRVSGGGGAAMAGNVLVGGIIGVGVDAGTGAMLDLTPNPLVVTLEQAK